MTPRPVRIGCSGWQYKSWREIFYPPRLPARRWLEHYATRFDTVEVNSTFYRLPQPAAGRRRGAPPPARLRLRAEGEPVPHAHEAPDGHGPRRRPLLRVDRTARRVAQARPGPVAAARRVPPRRRPPRSRAREPA